MDNFDDDWGRPRPRFEVIFKPREMAVGGDCAEKHAEFESSNREMDVESERSEPMENNVDTPSQSNRVMPLIDFVLPGMDGAPGGELIQKYVNDEGLTDIKNCYTTWSALIPQDTQPKFTCVFTCPITGEHFACGHWKNTKGVWHYGNIFWYTNKKNAMNAAAARTLDCFSLRKCHETEMKPFQRCEDMPYLKGYAPDLPSLPDGISLPTLVHELPIRQTMPPLPPKRALNDWYLKYGKQLLEIGAIPRAEANFTPGKEFYSSWSNYKKGSNTRYTAVFTCPWTGERFASGGILGEEDKFSEVMNIFVTKPCPDESGLEARVCSQEDKEKYIGNWVGSVHKVNLIWYKTKKEAENAAAARAVDCLVHRERVERDGSTTRYCAEEPYTFEETPSTWKFISGSVNRVLDIHWSKNSPHPAYVKWRVVPVNEHLTVPVGETIADLVEEDRGEYRRMRLLECE